MNAKVGLIPRLDLSDDNLIGVKKPRKMAAQLEGMTDFLI